MKNKPGRKSKYETHIVPNLSKISGWKKQGYTEQQIQKMIGIGHDAWNKYKKQHKEFSDVLKNGKEELTMAIENTLFKRAIDGEPWAVQFYLNNYAGKMTEYQKRNLKLIKERNGIESEKENIKLVIVDDLQD